MLALPEALNVRLVYQYWTIILQNHSVSLVAEHVGENEEVELLFFLFSGHLQAPYLGTNKQNAHEKDRRNKK